METKTPITDALARLRKLDAQFERGQISRKDLELQRTIVLVDTVHEFMTREI